MERRDRAEGSDDDSRYRRLVDAITDYAIYMLDPNGIVSSWNPGARRFKGYEREEILGRHFSIFYTEEDREAGIPALALRTAAESGRFNAEGWRLRKDGGRFWASVVIDPIHDADGAVVGFAKVTRDLTDRRAADEALRRSEQQFRLLVQSVTDYAIFMLDPQGNVASWNAGAERIKGYAPAEILGEHISVFYTPEEQIAGLPRLALETAAREGRFESEGQRVRKDGSRFDAHVVLDAVHDETGRPIGFAKITRDISERLQAQRELEATREALFQSQKIEAVGQLTGGVAHDFNNLLAVVMGGLEVLRRRVPDEPRTRAILDDLVRAVDRGAALTRRMLAFARRQDLVIRAVDVAALVAGMTELLERSLGPAIAIETPFPADVPPVRTDSHHLETALINLAVNARDAMPEGGTITFSAAPAVPDPTDGLPPGAYVAVAVTDSGSGMDEATLARAVEPFFTTKGVGKGTGLGLSMVHGLAEQSGGRMRIRSRVGIGTTVELLLPAAAPEDVRDEPARPRPVPTPGRRLAVLAVDDDELVLAATAGMLEDLGHAVVAVPSAARALGLVESGGAFDLVLTDQVMPEMTGAELAARLAAIRPELPILVVTGYSDLPADLPAHRLAKPFSRDGLAAAIADATAGRTGPRAVL
ncbi:hybrid sensor histidine kinase/response regulator [Oharaeibacter diazotrophicus]|uniref:histidine kinase n=1 Tax=Oharaeibacter diazotrophicus TaxID=1920512 RepID=A0A4R6RL56_9HYPH|nr:PAS domain-containing sensor histidine kinase [Oharaeibacter diazotrophicus]TDP87391.1 PAS domain S-box-containing protein [Oharaeibacter diazotrophicus]BBE70666.1 blue-light-activated protein [Pleomorphomonas sp. SM30]GLS77412.1 histidine kinase [Oharaeibacter diazotrophicus]